MSNAYVRFLKDHPVFTHLNDDYHSLLAGHMNEVSIGTGENLIQEGKAAESFYILTDGAVDLFARLKEGEQQWIQMINPGEVIGWSWLVPPYRWAFDARARIPCRLISFDAKAVRDLCERNPAFGFGTMKRICALMMERLHTVRTQMAGRIQQFEGG